MQRLLLDPNTRWSKNRERSDYISQEPDKRKTNTATVMGYILFHLVTRSGDATGCNYDNFSKFSGSRRKMSAEEAKESCTLTKLAGFLKKCYPKCEFFKMYVLDEGKEQEATFIESDFLWTQLVNMHAFDESEREKLI